MDRQSAETDYTSNPCAIGLLYLTRKWMCTEREGSNGNERAGAAPSFHDKKLSGMTTGLQRLSPHKRS